MCMKNKPRPISVAVHTWVVAYDVSDTRRRTEIAKMLRSFGNRVQFSVFECRMNENEITSLRRKIMDICNIKEDRIRWYPLCVPVVAGPSNRA